MEIIYIHEPTDLQCGQAVLAMICGTTTDYVCSILNNERETDLRQMKKFLSEHGFECSAQRMQAACRENLPTLALLSLETPRCWHWSLYANGIFYDPEHGVMKDFPECSRKYYWEIIPDSDERNLQ